MPPDIKFKQVRAGQVGDSLLDECAKLFEQHYGVWADSDEVPTSLRGRQIRLTAKKLKQYLPNKDSWVATARIGDDLVGYAMATKLFDKKNQNPISWVTQLVVHADFRKQLVGSRMLNSIWGFSNDFGWGIASANPFAVRALEKATRRRCVPDAMIKNLDRVKEAMSGIHYLSSVELNVTRSPGQSMVDTSFFQDISSVGEMIEFVKVKHPWVLGGLKEGCEWLATTFRTQEQLHWSEEELEKFMGAAKEIVAEAYERMFLGVMEKNHPWAAPEKAEAEIKFLMKEFALPPGASVLDFGSGSGRHSVALGNLGYKVCGIDASEQSINYARSLAAKSNLEAVGFLKGDCQTIKLNRQFDAAICLYDVIGSMPDADSNTAVLKNLIDHLKPGAPFAISVMSYDFTIDRQPTKVTNGDISRHLEQLRASETMQGTGDVFDPKFILVDTKRQIIYRKETFDLGDNLPCEIVVRDRRFKLQELKDLFAKLSLKVCRCGYVRAGKFEDVLSEDAESHLHREILVIGRKELI